jgi:hypothetical protein
MQRIYIHSDPGHLKYFNYILTNKKRIKTTKKGDQKASELANSTLPLNNIKGIALDTVEIDQEQQTLILLFNENMAYLPWREEYLDLTTHSIKEELGRRFQKFDVLVTAAGKPINTLIPNFYRKALPLDSSRFSVSENPRIPIVRRLDREIPTLGLYIRT